MKLVFFYSEGSPRDNALNLTKNKDLLIEKASENFDEVIGYTPLKLKELGFGNYVKEYSNSGLVSCNPGMSKIGFCAWRPLILLLELEKMKDEDILIYRDSNIEKYPTLGEYNDIKNIAEKCLEICGFDFFIPHHSFPVKNRELTKTNVLRELGDDHPFSYEFPALMCGFIVIRKNKIVIELLKEWLIACENESWINGEQYGELDSEFDHSTPEQSILSVIIANWIRTRKYSIPLCYPLISFEDKHIHKFKIHQDLSYLNLLQLDGIQFSVIPHFMQEKLSIKNLYCYIKSLSRQYYIKKRNKIFSK